MSILSGPHAMGHDEYLPGQDLPGTVYRIVRLIGEGQVGRVYEVEDSTLGRRYALKTMGDAQADARELARRLLRGPRILVKVADPHVVDVYAAGVSSDGQCFYVMDMLDGEPLGAVLRREGRLGLDAALSVGIDLSEALASVHAAGVVHRDVKPDNIFIAFASDLSTSTKLLDLAVASARAGVEATWAAAHGTFGYASPEQLRGEPASPLMDIWSLGCVLYEAISGRLPFEVSSDWRTFVDGVLGPSPAPRLSDVSPDAPADLVSLVARMLQKEPSRRLPRADMASATLRRIERRFSSRPPPGPIESSPADESSIRAIARGVVPEAQPEGRLSTEGAAGGPPDGPHPAPDHAITLQPASPLAANAAASPMLGANAFESPDAANTARSPFAANAADLWDEEEEARAIAVALVPMPHPSAETREEGTPQLIAPAPANADQAREGTRDGVQGEEQGTAELIPQATAMAVSVQAEEAGDESRAPSNAPAPIPRAADPTPELKPTSPVNGPVLPGEVRDADAPANAATGPALLPGTQSPSDSQAPTERPLPSVAPMVDPAEQPRRPSIGPTHAPHPGTPDPPERMLPSVVLAPEIAGDAEDTLVGTIADFLGEGPGGAPNESEDTLVGTVHDFMGLPEGTPELLPPALKKAAGEPQAERKTAPESSRARRESTDQARSVPPRPAAAITQPIASRAISQRPVAGSVSPTAVAAAEPTSQLAPSDEPMPRRADPLAVTSPSIRPARPLSTPVPAGPIPRPEAVEALRGRPLRVTYLLLFLSVFVAWMAVALVFVRARRSRRRPRSP